MYYILENLAEVSCRLNINDMSNNIITTRYIKLKLGFANLHLPLELDGVHYNYQSKLFFFCIFTSLISIV